MGGGGGGTAAPEGRWAGGVAPEVRLAQAPGSRHTSGRPASAPSAE